eukprot:13669563-Ditylum_brightwellii.AAC.1
MLNLTSGAASISRGSTRAVPATGPGTGAPTVVTPAVLTAAQIAALAAAVVAAIPALQQHQESYSKNPYAEDINPTTKKGFALYFEAIKSVPSDQRLEIMTNNAKKLIDMFMDQNSKFG